MLIVCITLIMGLSACVSIKEITAVNDLGKGFMTAIRKGDTASSWNMLSEGIHSEVGDLSAWGNYIQSLNFSEWSFTNTEVYEDEAQMVGTAALGEDVYTVKLWFTKTNDTWLISSININLEK